MPPILNPNSPKYFGLNTNSPKIADGEKNIPLDSLRFSEPQFPYSTSLMGIFVIEQM